MKILEDLLKPLSNNETVDNQVKRICDQILKEESENITNYDDLPTGPNIFLSLSCPPQTSNQIAFLCLEREMEAEFVVSLRVKKIDDKKEVFPHRIKVWEVKDSSSPRKILEFYAQKLKFVRGE